MAQTKEMSMWDDLSKIDNRNTTWMLRLRAVRVYFIPAWAKGGDFMEVIFHDENSGDIVGGAHGGGGDSSDNGRYVAAAVGITVDDDCGSECRCP
ncbi:hypothetical protein DM860_008498 [Cuscuta australis]|uniref:Uncharacterized protein n=1 Tax=Cuscuta australis TaxID=267555 RepID=A0A328D6P7_9ASTE|nr:hypothetical protein DM860_008498 [Cuscuta australis]